MMTKQKGYASEYPHSVAFVDLPDSGDIVSDIKAIIWGNDPD